MFHHVIDPRTGTMSSSDLVQVTVSADEAWQAEVTATTALLMPSGEAFRWLQEQGATAIVMMDADGQDDPAELPRLVARLDDGFDLVTGARVQRNDRFIKRHTSRLYNWATGRLSGAPAKDRPNRSVSRGAS